MQNPVNQTSMWAWTAAAFFLIGLGIVITQPEASQVNPILRLGYVAQICFIGFHLAMLPVIMNLNAPAWAKGAGYGWIVVDNAIGVMSINGVDNGLTFAARLGVHIATATWVLAASFSTTVTAVRWVGALAGVWIGGYSLVAPFVSPTLFYPVGLLLLAWVTCIAATSRPKTEPVATSTPTI